METQKKACDFEAKGFLNNYVFFAPDTEFPPTLDQIVKCSAPTQKLKKKIRKKNWNEKSRKSSHSHTYTWCTGRPSAARSENQQNDRYIFKVENSQKIKIRIGIHKTIGQTQAQRQANTKVNNHTKIDETNQHIIQPNCQTCNQQIQNWNWNLQNHRPNTCTTTGKLKR